MIAYGKGSDSSHGGEEVDRVKKGLETRYIIPEHVTIDLLLSFYLSTYLSILYLSLFSTNYFVSLSRLGIACFSAMLICSYFWCFVCLF